MGDNGEYFAIGIWALFFVLRDPAAFEACRKEADEVMGPWFLERKKPGTAGSGDDEAQAVTEMLTSMPILTLVFRRPFVFVLGRSLEEGHGFVH